MGFFSGIKDILNIGGVSVKLHVPEQLSLHSINIAGKVTLTSKSDKNVAFIRFDLIEQCEQGSGAEAKKQEYTLGSLMLNEKFFIKAEDVKEFDFTMPFKFERPLEFVKANQAELKGNMKIYRGDVKLTYLIKVFVDVAEASLDPQDKKEIRFV